MPDYLIAAFWGFASGSALLIGALIAWYVPVSKRVIAAIMAFGSGVLISALSFDLMDEALDRGGFAATAAGFLAGAGIYTLANLALARFGARHRKRSGERQPSDANSGNAIALGAILDGIPESIAIGVSMIAGGAVGWVTVVAIFLSNIPEGLSSAAGMKQAGRSAAYVFGLWTSVALLTGICSLIGFTVFDGFPVSVIAATQAIAAGAILAMIADTMMPEAFENTHDYAGLITVAGFLSAFALSKLGS